MGKQYKVTPLFLFLFPFIVLSNIFSSHKQISVNGKTFNAQIADNFISRALGYMFRDPHDVKDNECILFVYDNPTTVSFWMLDVHFKIDLCVLDENNTIVKRVKMYPHSLVRHTVVGRRFLEIKSS